MKTCRICNRPLNASRTTGNPNDVRCLICLTEALFKGWQWPPKKEKTDDYDLETVNRAIKSMDALTTRVKKASDKTEETEKAEDKEETERLNQFLTVTQKMLEVYQHYSSLVTIHAKLWVFHTRMMDSINTLRQIRAALETSSTPEDIDRIREIDSRIEKFESEDGEAMTLMNVWNADLEASKSIILSCLSKVTMFVQMERARVCAEPQSPNWLGVISCAESCIATVKSKMTTLVYSIRLILISRNRKNIRSKSSR